MKEPEKYFQSLSKRQQLLLGVIIVALATLLVSIVKQQHVIHIKAAPSNQETESSRQSRPN